MNSSDSDAEVSVDASELISALMLPMILLALSDTSDEAVESAVLVLKLCSGLNLTLLHLIRIRY